MKAKELRALSEAELTAKEAELRKSLMKLYGQVSTGTPPKNPGEIRRNKRTLAQILTIKTENAKKPAAKPATTQKAAPAKASVAKTQSEQRSDAHRAKRPVEPEARPKQ